MIKVFTYIETVGSEKYKVLLNNKFSLNLFNKSNNFHFYGWYVKSMGNWDKVTSDDGTILEFYPTHYKIHKKEISHQMPLPKTVNDFINDMYRFGFNLFWGESIFNDLEPKDIFSSDEIKKYFEVLLEKMGKSFELLIDGNE